MAEFIDALVELHPKHRLRELHAALATAPPRIRAADHCGHCSGLSSYSCGVLLSLNRAQAALCQRQIQFVVGELILGRVDFDVVVQLMLSFQTRLSALSSGSCPASSSLSAMTVFNLLTAVGKCRTSSYDSVGFSLKYAY